MKTITRNELKNRLERHEPTRLVMALGKWAYEQLHIPGSLSIEDLHQANGQLARDEEIVIYCANPACPASYRAYYQLQSQGFTRILRFSGGIEEWMEAGLPVEGNLA